MPSINRIRLSKAVSFIHNSEDSEHQYSSVANSDDAYDTASYILWHSWALADQAPIAGDDIDQFYVESLVQQYSCSNRQMTFYKFALDNGGTLTLSANREHVLLSAVLN